MLNITVIRLVDWTEARIREAIYQRLVNRKKLPYTSAGFSIIEGAIRTVLASTPGYSRFNVTTPNPVNASQAARAARVAEGFEFTATLSSAIHFVEVQGTVQV